MKAAIGNKDVYMIGKNIDNDHAEMLIVDDYRKKRKGWLVGRLAGHSIEKGTSILGREAVMLSIF